MGITSAEQKERRRAIFWENKATEYKRQLADIRLELSTPETMECAQTNEPLYKWAATIVCAKIQLEQLVATVSNENKRLQEWVNDLQAGMYINCVYCGHRYGPDDEVPVAMADVLKEHIEQCPQHPMSKLKEQLAAAEEKNEHQQDMQDVGEHFMEWYDHAVKRTNFQPANSPVEYCVELQNQIYELEQQLAAAKDIKA